ncbi:MAG: VOC family protein [Planctomycetota bacterium]
MPDMKLPIDHVAVPAKDIGKSVSWYTDHFGAKVLYQDDTWAFLKMGTVKLALVTPGQHPPHVALRVDEDQLAQQAAAIGMKPDTHRDGTAGVYMKDPDGNAVELIYYPDSETAYDDA